MNKLYPVFQYGWHWLHRVNEHSLHSPFIYALYTECIKKDVQQGFESIEALRKQLLNNHKLIEIEDLGAGSRVSNGTQRKISDIARHSSSPARFSRLLSRLIDYFQYEEVIELGTSLGLNTLHMAQARSAPIVHTIEGSQSIAQLANQHFTDHAAENIQLYTGDIDEVLPNIISDLQKVDMAYLDANHRYKPTLRYYDLIRPRLHAKSIVVLDDIHWSAEMNQAWKKLCQRPEVSLSLDLYEGGILFLNPDLPREQYVLAF